MRFSLVEKGKPMKAKLVELIEQAKYCTAEELADYLISAGLVLLIRCKDCKNYNTRGCANGFGWCEAWDNGRCDDHFCNFGKVRDNGKA